MSTPRRTPKVKMTWNEYDSLVHYAMAAASTEDTLPSLNAVRLFAQGPQLFAEATDRYKMIQTRAPRTVVVNPAFNALIPLSLIKRVKAAARAPRWLLDHAEVTITKLTSADHESLISITVTAPEFTVSLSAPGAPGAFPPLNKIITSAREAVAEQGLDPVTNLRGWDLDPLITIAKREQLPIELHLGAPRRPVFFRIGEALQGLITPLRNSTDTIGFTTWTGDES